MGSRRAGVKSSSSKGASPAGTAFCLKRHQGTRKGDALHWQKHKVLPLRDALPEVLSSAEEDVVSRLRQPLLLRMARLLLLF